MFRFALSALLLLCGTSGAGMHPNIILIMADDLGWGDTGYNGHPRLKTPNLDRLSREGLRFDRFYAAAPVCSPTRGSCLTGRHPFRYGVFSANVGHLPAQEICLAEVLKDQGYMTGHFGKWHLGTLSPDYSGKGPRRQPRKNYSTPGMNGFTEWFSTEFAVATWDPYDPKHSHLRKGMPYDTRALYWHNGVNITKPLRGCDSKIIMDRVIPFVQKAVAEGKPFFAVIWFHAPHEPVIGGPPYLELYKNLPEGKRHYYAVVTAMDDQIGRLRRVLEKLNAWHNTMLWFCSDNGPEGNPGPRGRSQGSAGPFRGRKRSLYEGGIRVPGILVWPERIKEPRRTDIPCVTSDYLPTVLDVLGLPLPEDRAYDGVSLLPLIQGRMKKRPKPIGFQHGVQAAWSDNRYKLVHNRRTRRLRSDNGKTPVSEWELYDLVADPGETKNIAALKPGITASMRAALEKWRASCRADFEKSRRFSYIRGSKPKPAALALHPRNPHYFLWQGRPAVIVGSGEHYGEVLNLDFDFETYLRTLKRSGLNHTRTFSGVYRELPSSFGITDNPLAPKPGRYICPWPRTAEPGCCDGGGKFDLRKWNPAYFKRLKDFVQTAAECGVIVELNLFCPFYNENLWKISPMNAANNVNGIGKCKRTEVYALKEKALTEVQLAFVRKVVKELQDFDNVYYEVCNEPYFGGVTREWQWKIADTIVETERALPKKHLISMNIANGRAAVVDPHPAVSIFNFHYCVPPDTVAMNYHLNKVIGENETGFRGKADIIYRTEAWDFLLAGGALFSHLDYSFTPQHPDGTFRAYRSPGGGSPELRAQLAFLKRFLEEFDLLQLRPFKQAVKSVDPKLTVSVLADPGKDYALYLHVPLPKKPKDLKVFLRRDIRASLKINLPEGTYRVSWFDTKTGEPAAGKKLRHRGGTAVLNSPRFSNDIALRIRRAE